MRRIRAAREIRMTAERSTLLGVGLVFLLAACTHTPKSDDQKPELGSTQQALTTCADTPGWTLRPYRPGERVMVEGNLYACKPWPYNGWCGIGDAYEPGVGWAWRDAWIEAGKCGTATCDGVP